MYYRYVDDTFVIFHDEKHCDSFLSKLNSLHPALQFTHEKECNLTLPFLDVLVGKTESEFFTAVYRKPTFTGQYLRWNSFSPQKRKLNLILTHRALKICSPDKLQLELDKIMSILLAHGYPDDVIKSAIETEAISGTYNIWSGKMPSILASPVVGVYFYEIRKASESRRK